MWPVISLLQENAVVSKVIVQNMVAHAAKIFPGGLGYKEFSGFDCVSWPEHDLQESYETLDTYRNAKHKLQGKQCR